MSEPTLPTQVEDVTTVDMPRTEPSVQEQVLRTWDGIRFEEEVVPMPEPNAEDTAAEPSPEEAEYQNFSIIQKYHKDPVKTSLPCTHCGKSNLIYFINNWNNSRFYNGRRYATTDLLCTRCGSMRSHILCEPNDIEYYYLGIKK